ncbi:MAG: zinc ribbon domain-containing protein [Candidatus Bathyarchaeia archaeon]|jgi:hypothetical protein
MPSLKRTLILVCLFIAIIIVGVNPQLSLAQFIPCRIVNLNLTLPNIVQAGQPFQITTTLTVSCDPSVLPVVRVDLVDATTSQILSTTTLPNSPSSSSFIVPVVNRATARSSPGSWALQVEGYVLNGINGAAVASTSQLFQLNVMPYTPPVTTMETIQMTTQASSISSAASYSFPTLTTVQENQTQALQTSQVTFSTSTTPDLTGQLLPALALVLVALAIFALLFYAGGKRARKNTAGVRYCGQCGSKIEENSSFCTNCGAKEEKQA